MTAPWFTDHTGPVDFVAEGFPAPRRIRGISELYIPGKLFIRDGRRTHPSTSAAETVTSWANGTTLIGAANSRASIASTHIAEDTPTRVVTRRAYADGRTVWTIRPRTTGARIEVFEAGEPRHADLEAAYRSRR
jgi:predicted DNA binding protein